MNIIASIWGRIQNYLFPNLENKLGPLSEQEKKLVAILETAQIESFIPHRCWTVGRPEADRTALARAYIAKVVYNAGDTKNFIEQINASVNLRLICGWREKSDVPSESTFSRSFAEFAQTELPQRAHAEIVEKYEKDRLVGHLSNDGTDIAVREKAAKKKKDDKPKLKLKRGRPKKGDKRPDKKPTRLQKQPAMTLDEMQKDLPTECDRGVKKKDGKTYRWKGYGLHVSWADGEIPIACLLTSASLNDSQVAIPLMAMSAERVTNLYDLMDAGYDAKEIKEYSKQLGHVPIIAQNPRRGEKIEMDKATKRRYKERSTAERGFSFLKESFGGQNVMVRGAEKVMAHLMFGILALTADRLLRLVM